ncbi:MAG TPA: TonB-dependent receptor [Candidatus Acidoferrales bacterium]|nr:TonB-dependent receptor [Candidatus Acidoferrales bacterium]HEV2340534.1 TonB-dependent receptor [Candidatus Acidoferrales bacterium]
MRLCVRLFLLFVVFVFAFFGISIPSPAQSTAALSGRITDRSGAAIVGAEISAQDLNNGATQETKSTADGTYSLTLAPGKFRIRVTSPQMAATEEDISLIAGERRTWNVRVELAELSSTVVVTAQAEPEPANTVASPVTALTHQDIEQRQEIWAAPLLASAPGVSLSSTDPLGGVTGIFLDGGNSNFTKVLVDGTPVNEPGGSIDLSNADLSNVDKIEVVHGASSALFGSDAMTGVVQIFTHRGTTHRPQLTLVGEGGMFDTGRGAADLSGKVNRFDYASSVSHFNSAGQGPNDRFRDTTLSGNYGWKFSDSDNLRLSLRNAASDAGLPGQTLDPQIGVPYPCLISSVDLHDFSSNLGWDFSTGSHWQHHVAGTESYDRRMDVNGFCFAGSNFAEQFNRASFEEQSSYLFRSGGVSLGYDYEVENGSSGGPHIRRNNQGGYLETHYQLGRRLTAIAGVRAEANAAFGTRVVPRTGLNFVARYGRGFWGATRLRASYGLGIKEPEFFQSFSSDPCFPGNPNLKPERSNTLDAGIDQIIAAERVKFSANFFHNSFRDIVSFASCGTTGPCNFPPPPTCTPADEAAEGGFGEFFNTDAARADGVNATIEAKPLAWLGIIGNYTYDDSRVLKAPNAFDPTLAPGNRLFLRPLHSADLILNAAWRRMNWNLAGYYVGRTTDSDFLGLSPGFKTLPSYVRLDLGTQFFLGHGVTTIAHVGNLLNRRYEDAIGYPALGLNYRAGVKYVWGAK